MTLTKIDFAARLERLKEKLGDGALLLMSQPEAVRNSDVQHHYRQESFFHYLTGFNEPEAALLVLPNNPKGDQALLFNRVKDKTSEIWTGARLGQDDAPKTLPIDKAYPITELWDDIHKHLRHHTKIFYHLGVDPASDRNLMDALKRARSMRPRLLDFFLPVYPSEMMAASMRMVKEPAEIERMQRAADITAKAFDKVFKADLNGMNERQVLAMITGEFLFNGAEMEAYPSIIAGGENACCLHYEENNAPLRSEDLLLIDAGAQFEYYAADVTRTFPVGGRLSTQQKELYEITLKAQMAALAHAKPGTSLTEIHKVSIETIVDGLKDLKLLTGSKDEIIENNIFKRFFPHGTGHWLGMDVHDVGFWSERVDGEAVPTILEPGMAFTIEPGIYVQPDDMDAPEQYRGIGIRIEDDVVITDDGHLNLTKAIPKSLGEMER